MRIGVQLPEVERQDVSWPEYLALARAAEAAGFDSIWLGDHLLYRGDGEERDPWEAWTLLGALAAVTERVDLGPLVACTAFHPPGRIAKMAATVAEIAAGRFVLGLGAGWTEDEFRAFGLPYDHRVSRFEESFTVIRGLLSGERVTLHGRFVQAEDAVRRTLAVARHVRPRGPDDGGRARRERRRAPQRAAVVRPEPGDEGRDHGRRGRRIGDGSGEWPY